MRRGDSTRPPRWLIRGIVFLTLFAALQAGWQALRDTAIQRVLIDDGVVRPAAALVNWLTPSVHARAVQSSVIAPGGGLDVLNGCEGVEAVFLLAAAFVIAPVSLRARLTGFVFGIPLVFIVNEARILSLFYAYRSDRALFDTLHGTVAPIAVVVLVACYFYACLAYSSAPRVAGAI